VKLVKNFRSHPRILDFPNGEFYRGDLIACGGNDINAYRNWEHLPKKGFPVVFHAVAGEDMREASSPSYFNVDEITQVKLYVKLLLSDKNISIGKLARCSETLR
jgi:helicase MOV-10